MENVGYAALQIIPTFKGIDQKLTSGTSGPMAKAGLLGGRTFGDSAGRSLTSSVKAHAKTAALAGAAVFTAVGVAGLKLAKDSIAEAREAQKVGGLTEAVLKSTGHAAGISADQIGKMANRLSLVSGVDDEVIQRGENMLLTFKGIKDYVKGQYVGTFDQASQATLDMAAAMAGGKGGELDLKSSSILVGKALNDPVKGLTALQRVGVSFTKQQQAQIKALVEGGDANAAMATGLIQTSTEFSTLLKGQNGDLSKTVAILTNDLTPAQKKTYDMYAEGGHTLEAQQRILKELNSEFGGAAAAQATMGEKVKVAWGNIEEQLGTAILPLVDQAERALLNKGVPAVEGWADAFQKKGVPAIRDLVHTFRREGIPAISNFYDEAKPVAEDVLPAIFDLMKAGQPIVKTTAGLVGDLAEGFTKIPRWAQVAIAGGLLTGKVGGFKLVGSLFSRGASSLASRAAPLPVIVMNPGFGAEGAAAGSIQSMTVKNVAKLGLYGLTAAAIIYGLDKGQKEARNNARNWAMTGPSGVRAGAARDEDGIDPTVRRQLANQQNLYTTLAILGRTTDDIHAKITGLGDGLDLVGNKKIHPELTVPGLRGASEALGAFISQEVTAGQDITPYVRINGLERANQQLDRTLGKIHAVINAGIGEGGAGYVSGGQRAGANIHIEHAHINDGRDLLQKSQQAAMGGRPW